MNTGRWAATLALLGLCGSATACLGGKYGSAARAQNAPNEEQVSAMPYDDEHGVATDTSDAASAPPAGPLPAMCEFKRVEIDVQGQVRVDGAASGGVSLKSAPSLAAGLWERLGPCFLRVLNGVGGVPHQVEVPSGASIGQVLGVLSTLVHAGYPWLRLDSGDAKMELRLSSLPAGLAAGASVPVPSARPSVPEQERKLRDQSPFDFHRPKRLLLVRLEGQNFELVWASQSPENPIQKRLLVPQTTAPAELRRLLVKACADSNVSCKRVFFEAPPSTPLQTIATILNALPAQKKAPLVEIAFLDQAITGRMKAAEALGLALESGSVDQAAVTAQIQSHMPEVMACYQKGLERDATLQGRLLMRFSLEPNGSVSDVMDARVGALPGVAQPGQSSSTAVSYTQASAPASDLLQDDAVASCVHHVFERLKLPRPTGGSVLVLYPLQLSPG